MPLAEISPAEAKPVSLIQIKNHLRIDHNEDDQYLTELLDAATFHVEAVIGHFLINRTLRQYIEDLPKSRSICLEAWPINAIVEIRCYDLDGNQNVLPSNQYKLDRRLDPSALIFDMNINANSFCNGIEIDLIAGYGETGVDVPSNITRAILVLIAHWYEFRGTMSAGDETGLVPEGLNKLLAPVKRVRL